ncbi:damage-control phosphatase ARMT1 family protein [Hydrogenimonas urashimensis]|uniref:damage-control phosphatase ARMT1 family protein n=1 Tax=Hydrogenimonas urashimensis TaxID=2740515 RepID=UPI0019150D3A|nr:ARMT1-like domain-containing protein [Hydrogenimonas urashimensis]
MKMTPECVACIFSQALRVCETLGVDRNTTKKVLDRVGCDVPAWSFDQTPPQVAARVYPMIAEILRTDDIYRDFKREATEHARAFIPFIEATIEKSVDRFHAALKAAVAGNVIDLAATEQFDLEEEVAKVFETPFAIDDSARLRQMLESARNVLVIGDNAGEHLFDKLLIRELKRLYPDIRFGYVVRGVPIINDVTFQEAKEAGLDEVAVIIDSGVDTPGLDLSRMSETMRRHYNEADLVISKGMGNYESLNDTSTRPTFYLLKIKCSVVAASLGKSVGEIICYKGECND